MAYIRQTIMMSDLFDGILALGDSTFPNVAVD